MIDTGLTLCAKQLMLELLAKEKFKVALYDGSADIGPRTTKYTATGEVRGKGYKAGGVELHNAKVWMDRDCACLSWDSPVLPVTTISANGFMIYLPARDGMAVFVGGYNATFTSTEGPFTISIATDQICLE